MKVGTLELEVLGNYKRYIDEKIPIIFSIAFNLLTSTPYVWLKEVYPLVSYFVLHFVINIPIKKWLNFKYSIHAKYSPLSVD